MLSNEFTPLTSKGYDKTGLGLVSSYGCDVALDKSRKRPPGFKSPPSSPSIKSNVEIETGYAFAVKMSLIVNFFLLVLKIFIFYTSSSLAFLASAVDSFLDLVSQSIIYYAIRGNENVDERIYPLGRARLEPVGIVVVASLMGMSSLQVVLESLITLETGILNPEKISPPLVDATSVSLLLVSILLKVGLYYICNKHAQESDSMLALSQDHRNDILSNSVALLAAFSASKEHTLWFLDPLGAILISCFIVMNWVEMAREQTDKLVGRTAETVFLDEIEEMSRLHDERLKVDIVRAYHFGSRFLVEIEIVMEAKTTLRVAHDVALELQQKVETLDQVERCHVHVDYDFRTEREHKATFSEASPSSRELIAPEDLLT